MTKGVRHSTERVFSGGQQFVCCLIFIFYSRGINCVETYFRSQIILIMAAVISYLDVISNEAKKFKM